MTKELNLEFCLGSVSSTLLKDWIAQILRFYVFFLFFLTLVSTTEMIVWMNNPFGNTVVSLLDRGDLLRWVTSSLNRDMKHAGVSFHLGFWRSALKLLLSFWSFNEMISYQWANSFQKFVLYSIGLERRVLYSFDHLNFIKDNDKMWKESFQGFCTLFSLCTLLRQMLCWHHLIMELTPVFMLWITPNGIGNHI